MPLLCMECSRPLFISVNFNFSLSYLKIDRVNQIFDRRKEFLKKLDDLKNENNLKMKTTLGMKTNPKMKANPRMRPI